MVELPPEAGNLDTKPFEPNDQWLASVSEELQYVAMRRWFLDRYEDPINETPWDGEDKCYIFVWGGPYDPNDEIQERFSGIVKFNVMRDLITDLWEEVGDEWAPIEHEGADYEDYVSHLIVKQRDDPCRFFSDRLDQIKVVLEAIAVDSSAKQLVLQMVHSSLIAALEAYLADTVLYWTSRDEQTLRHIVSTNKDFQKKSLKVAELFERFDGLKEEVNKYLTDLVWHRLDKIKPIIVSGLQIQVPDISELMQEIKVRHDIVHRAGRDSNGIVVDLSVNDLQRVLKLVHNFADAIEGQLKVRFPFEVETVT